MAVPSSSHAQFVKVSFKRYSKIQREGCEPHTLLNGGEECLREEENRCPHQSYLSPKASFLLLNYDIFMQVSLGGGKIAMDKGEFQEQISANI